MSLTPHITPYWQDACAVLSKNDPILARIIRDSAPNKQLISYQNPFYTFSKIIIGQQISVHAANAIFRRFEQAVDHSITAKRFLETSKEIILATGFSKPKYRYLHIIAELICKSCFFEDYKALEDVSDKTQKLLSIVGVGQWSADMFLIFHDLEPDICPLGDVGLVNAIKKYYQVQSNDDILKVCEPWHPYSTVATWFLWSAIDDEIVQY
ncbi:MAG: DNA-3-methyladenine glycosylase 2 family protein [bacterium]